MINTAIRQDSFLNEVSKSFTFYAEHNPKKTAYIMRSMLFSENEDPGEFYIRLRKFICLLLLVPERTSVEIISALSCFADNEENAPLLEQFFFEMARSEIFVHRHTADALVRFTSTSAENPADGIDHARFLGETVYGDRRMIEIINTLTDSISKPEEPSPDETN